MATARNRLNYHPSFKRKCSLRERKAPINEENSVCLITVVVGLVLYLYIPFQPGVHAVSLSLSSLLLLIHTYI